MKTAPHPVTCEAAGPDDFQKSPRGASAEACSEKNQNCPILKMFEREDWTLFRTVEGLGQKAGVAANLLRRLCLKELADNALDNNAATRVGQFGKDGRFFVEDDGPGLDGTPEHIAELFSIKRPMRSSKLLRKPQRGALGSGLRVVAGIVLASEGTLVVITRNRRIKLRPKADGSTAVVGVTEVAHPLGTRVEIGFGSALPDDPDALHWAKGAITLAGGNNYSGATSAWWYDAAQFHELILACGAQPVRSLVAQLDGCSGGKAGDIVAAAHLGRTACGNVSRAQATELLDLVRSHSRPVTADRLGAIGRHAFGDGQYVMKHGDAVIGGSRIPFVVEVWAGKKEKSNDVDVVWFCVNRTPITGAVEAYRDGDKDICLHGSGLGHYCSSAPKKGGFNIVVHVTTPYCPIMSDGKVPDLGPFVKPIMDAVGAATRKAQRAAPKDSKVTQNSVILDNLDDVVADVSGPAQHRFSVRQILYKMRPLVKEATGEDLQLGNFTAIVTDYEAEHGEIPRMYREPRGSIYHPHRKETIPLSTLTVERYERPPWCYNKLVYNEKEGFNEALKENGWFERNDCAPCSSKGFTTRAIKDLVDKLAEHDEPVTVFCVHDADAAGPMIYQTFQEATRARSARKIKIINLGLEPCEAVATGLEVETIPKPEKRRAIADYVLKRDAEFPNEAPGDTSWEEWLQTHRIELNAFTTPQFIEWLSAKIAPYVGKLIPPEAVIAAELEQALEATMRAKLTERILREAGLDEQVAEALSKMKRPSGTALVDGIKNLFERKPEREWRNHVQAEVAKRTKKI
jgi:hypothetical protein